MSQLSSSSHVRPMEPLNRVDGVASVHNVLVERDFAYESLSVGKGNDGWGGAVSPRRLE